MDNKKLANLLFPMPLKSTEYYEDIYKKRELKEGAIITRFAPSPTGLLHFGGVYTAYLANRVAKQTEGKYILRIEDTDKAREVEGGVEYIIKGLNDFDIAFDEKENEGEYGPYRQSERKEIYMAFAKSLVEEGKAYPCFCSGETLSADREQQERNKELLGYYGAYAHCRSLTYKEIEEKINAGEKFAIRLKIDSSPNIKIKVKDAIRGELRLSDNYKDVVVLKSDFLPPYNFAHAVDDHLMRVNLVVRGDEYIPSITEHIQIFKILGFEPINYAHIAPIQKIDEESGNKRKISKRKDPEAGIGFYSEAGYPSQSVMEYILTIANSNFEEWRKQNPKVNLNEFKVDFKKMGVSGALFDFAKLNDVSKTVISKFTAVEVYDKVKNWANAYDKNFAKVLESNKNFSLKMFNIEREQKRPRQDISKWSEVKTLHNYFYDELFNLTDKNSYEFDYDVLDVSDVETMLNMYLKNYNQTDEKQEWFNKIKQIATNMNGYADDMKEFKASPESFKGNYGTISTIVRIALTGRKQTPDLFAICELIGKESIANRIEKVLEILKK